MSITSVVIQAANTGISELTPEDLGPEDGFEVLARLGVGPRAATRCVRDLAERFGKGTDDAGYLAAFLMGVMSERLVTNLDLGVISVDSIHALAGPEVAYEGADVEDIQDVCQILFGVDSADGIDLDTALSLFTETASRFGLMPDIESNAQDAVKTEAEVTP